MDQLLNQDLTQDVIQSAEVLGKFADDESTFRLLVESYRAQDYEEFRELLTRFDMLDRCHLITKWLCSKECVLVCFELCGPPPKEPLQLNLREFAELTAKISSNREILGGLASAVIERDENAFRAIVEKLEMQKYCHYICHWICSVRCRLICEILCAPVKPLYLIGCAHLIQALLQSSSAVARLLEDENALAMVEKGVLARDCNMVRSALERAEYQGICHWICHWICSWRCVRVCILLCRPYAPVPIEHELSEMYAFAKAVVGLTAQPDLVAKLVDAIETENAEVYSELVNKLELRLFCHQLCHWLCRINCRRFCLCVCPPRTIAVFTKIGGLYYNTDVHSIAPGSGLTVADNRAFYNSLRLNGGLSLVEGAPLIEYMFETVNTSDDGVTLAGGGPILPTSWVPVTGAQIQATNIGSFIRWVGFILEVIPVNVNGPGAGVFNITPSADGWIQVPPMHPVPPMVPAGPAWTFVPGGDLIVFDSTTLAHVLSIDETGVIAGASANAPLQTDVHYGVRMRMRNQGASGDGVDAGTCHHIAINNTLYNNISHHPYWPGGLFGASNELALASIGIAELALAPCSVLTKSFTVEFTAAHSNLGAVSVWLEGPGGPYAFDLNPATAEDLGENWYGTATPAMVGSPPAPAWSFNTLPPCAYLLKMSVDVLLTTGDHVPLPIIDYIAFCKGKG